jgi:hypothetical protein
MDFATFDRTELPELEFPDLILKILFWIYAIQTRLYIGFTQ